MPIHIYQTKDIFYLREISLCVAWAGNKSQVFTSTNNIIVYKILYLREYFILAKNVAKIGQNESPSCLSLCFCNDLPKVAHIGWNKSSHQVPT